MSGQSGHNLRIARSRLGSPRFPFETKGAGDGYAGAGPIKTYKLNPEEIAARYGPPVPRKDRDLTRGEVKYAMESSTCLEDAARRIGVSIARIKKEMARHCIAVPEHWKEAEEMSLEEFKTTLTKEKYLELKRQGLSDKKILESVGLKYTNNQKFLTDAKKEWGVAGMIVRPQKEQQPEPSIQPSAGDTPENIIDQAPKVADDSDEQIAWVVPFKPAKSYPVLRFYQNGISINAAAARAMERVRNIRVGVTGNRIIVLVPSETKEGCYELGKLHKRGGSLKIGGTALVEQIKKHGVPFGKYRLEKNDAKGRWEARTDEAV